VLLAKAGRFPIGDPLIMKEIAKHAPDGALGYDKMASFLAAHGNTETLAVARDLDGKVGKPVRDAAG
jgi:hypothetical protein